MSAQSAPRLHPAPTESNSDLVQHIPAAIRSVRYGQVQIIIQNSRVVQIDKTEKLHLV